MEHDGRTYTLLNVIGSTTIPEGNYLLNPADRAASRCSGSRASAAQDAPAPQARLMSVVINGILNRKLPWGLVLLGVFLVIAVELLGIRSLSFAVGSYLVDRHHRAPSSAAAWCAGWPSAGSREKSDDEASPGRSTRAASSPPAASSACWASR